MTFRVGSAHVIDLKDPADPYIAGELKISGYSDYLQPVGENPGSERMLFPIPALAGG